VSTATLKRVTRLSLLKQAATWTAARKAFSESSMASRIFSGIPISFFFHGALARLVAILVAIQVAGIVSQRQQPARGAWVTGQRANHERWLGEGEGGGRHAVKQGLQD
jgi:hypothetical protein